MPLYSSKMVFFSFFMEKVEVKSSTFAAPVMGNRARKEPAVQIPTGTTYVEPTQAAHVG